MLRAEGLMVRGGALFVYADTGRLWWLLAALFLATDLRMLGYLASPRVGALARNALHSFVAPLALAGVSRGGGPGETLQRTLNCRRRVGMAADRRREMYRRCRMATDTQYQCRLVL